MVEFYNLLLEKGIIKEPVPYEIWERFHVFELKNRINMTTVQDLIALDEVF